MLRYFKWVFHPAVLILVSVVLVGAAMRIVLPLEPEPTRPQPAPLRPQEHELAWLYPATSVTTWERFALAMRQATERLRAQFPGLECEHDQADASTSATPQIALAWPDGSKLIFRWYKLTSQWTPQVWVDALLTRDRPPLAIIGGNNSFWAHELALCLERATAGRSMSGCPLLFLTTATADRVPRGTETTLEELGSEPAFSLWEEDSRTIELLSVYPGRSFRFCFSNRQMATAITRFIWSKPELRPDSDPAFLVQWTDDAYSRDLFAGYMRVLDYRAAENFIQQWGFVTGTIALRASPLTLAGWFTSGFRDEEAVQLFVDSSVGSFYSPNPFEAKVVRDLLVHAQRLPRRPLLVLTGQQQPSRRLLRDLARSAPDTTRRFLVATGDAISFNTIFRDRQVTWPIQDLPFTLVFFAHRNPIDEASGFRLKQEREPGGRTRASGTEDVLLYRDIIEASSLAFRSNHSAPVTEPESLGQRLRSLRHAGEQVTNREEGVPLFSANGQRSGGTGEHVVYLRPMVQGVRVLPRAVIEVWTRRNDRNWTRLGNPLIVSFDESEDHDDNRFLSN